MARELTMLIERRGKPQMVVSDNGTEFTCNAILSWARTTRSNGTTSRPTGQCRTAISNPSTVECVTSFSTKACSSISIRFVSGAWSVDYNTARPHSSLDYKTPAAYAGTLASQGALSAVL